ncbi:MAG TPA: M6 family metalloprotease domain-containing protein, partial [Ignavibacteriaceae bacterium]|nr:M6 family metalloprotease domain-containing protein [Ignavibacteriaceae bacterium]
MQKYTISFFLIIFCFYSYAIIPPKTGIKPPKSFVEFHKMIQGEYSKGYFAQKFNERKETREKISNGLSNKILEQDTVSALTLLGQYSNLPAGYSQQDFQNLLFNGPNPTGTITDYYSEVSYNQLLFTGTCNGWYNMPRTLEEYTGTNSGLGTQGGPRFVLDIITIADSTIDYSDYIQYYDDQNKPHIGFIAVVHSGADAAAGAFNIWSHRWSFTVITNGQPYISNDIDPVSGQNVIIDGDYAIQPERSGSNNSSGSLISIGVFAHEFGHIFGLPDLYDTDNSSEGLGNWCLMAGGAYGGNSSTAHTTVHMSAWCKKELGWVTPINITSSMNSL